MPSPSLKNSGTTASQQMTLSEQQKIRMTHKKREAQAKKQIAKTSTVCYQGGGVSYHLTPWLRMARTHAIICLPQLCMPVH